ncbi:DUF1003 domain-containing protein [Ethanoligenens harbinense]|uniref:DUF1003 domain-containing protein n=1 Tax=Ethanoligenens harbinense (strain DSM 18485 / JCM 12961 / CGMCC 1.5033 / YUAN-3) TaxID=663278 RepID=E6U528_ETHHY|nr:DUF1003 domain-containing protein [Ethanoligenens harbinense]ADU26734.1 protein of unknown function DUF1003 [Ethanoligenens harbinense YUAN-3]
MKEKSVKELADLILNDHSTDKEEEEALHLLIEKRLAKDIYKSKNGKLSLGDHMADNIAQFAGSWRFIGTFVACMIVWIILNALALAHPFDAYPFILLNLVLSCIAAIQAPIIMMSQNRQESKDRERSENDYLINLKSEIIIADLHEKLDTLLANQQRIAERLNRLEKKPGE